jgi:ABC-type sugar transport system ATPase subunit
MAVTSAGSPAPGGPAVGPLMRLHRVTKRFPGVVAVDDVSLDLAAGEIVALLGQNGAGKSTMIQIVAGVYGGHSYDGDLTLDGQPYRPAGVIEAERRGVVLIPQQVSVVPEMTVGQNMFLNNEPTTRLGLVDWEGLYARARRVLTDFGTDVDPRVRMGSLDLATQQLVVIARALSAEARLLILDEPTAALTENEARRLFVHLRGLRARGVSIVYVSHRLAEVFAIADRVVVLRDGRLRGDHRTADTTRDEVVGDMLGGSGGSRPDLSPDATPSSPPGEVALEVAGLSVRDPEDADRVRVDRLDLTVRRGETVGVFGLVGSGTTPAAMAIFGAWPGKVDGTIRVDGRVVRINRPADAIAHGVGMIAPDRRRTLILDHSVADNVVLASLRSLCRHGLLDAHAKTIRAEEYVRRLNIRTPSVRAPVGTLSGGNQQKVQVARWLAAQTRTMLLVDPTHGVDVGARAEIYRLLRLLARQRYALLLVSAEAEELVAVCDRVLVLRAGRAVGELTGAGLSESNLLHLAAGD